MIFVMTNTDNYTNIKAAVLSGMSGYAAARKYGVEPLSVAKRLSTDPDIVAAKAAGTVKSRAKRHKTTSHYLNLDYVKAVLEGGLSQTAAAAQFGKAQSQVAFGVKKAREELASLGRPTKSPPKAQQANHIQDPEIDALRALAAAYAARHGLTYSEVLDKLQ